jgi:uncharacterized protein YbjT (DUF2867 family)
LIESGLPYTILQPTSFMENIPLPTVLSSGTLSCPYTPDVLQGFLSLQDCAAVAARALLDPSPHAFARYELVGENRTLTDVAKLVSQRAGKEIKVEVIPREKAVKKFAEEKGMGTLTERDNFERMLFYYDKR